MATECSSHWISLLTPGHPMLPQDTIVYLKDTLKILAMDIVDGLAGPASPRGYSKKMYLKFDHFSYVMYIFRRHGH